MRCYEVTFSKDATLKSILESLMESLQPICSTNLYLRICILNRKYADSYKDELEYILDREELMYEMGFITTSKGKVHVIIPKKVDDDFISRLIIVENTSHPVTYKIYDT